MATAASDLASLPDRRNGPTANSLLTVLNSTQTFRAGGILRFALLRPSLRLRLQRRPCRGNDVVACVGVAIDAPAALRRFGDKYPRAIGQGRVTGCCDDDLGQLLHDAELLLAIEHANGREHLDANVVAVAAGIRDRTRGEVMDERGRVVEKQGNLGHPLPAHDRFREILRKRVLVPEGAFGGEDVDHRHGEPPCAPVARERNLSLIRPVILPESAILSWCREPASGISSSRAPWRCSTDAASTAAACRRSLRQPACRKARSTTTSAARRPWGSRSCRLTQRSSAPMW